MKKTLTILSIFFTSILYAQTPCDQRVIENVDFSYTGGGAAPARWNVSQTNPHGFLIDEAAYNYVGTGNFSNLNLNPSGGTNNTTRQYAITANPNTLSPQYANIATDGMMVINPQQGQNDQYATYTIAGLIPGNVYTVEIKVWNVIDMAMPGACGQWCNWNDQLLVDWAGNGNNAHDGLGTMNWTGTNGSGGWNGYGNQIDKIMKISAGGASAVMTGQVTLANATTGFTLTFKKGNSSNPIVLGIDYIKVYGCQEEAINVSGGTTNVCEGTDITLTAQGLGPAGSSYTWTRNGIPIPGRNSDTLNVISEVGAGTTVTYEATGQWSKKSVPLTSKICCSSVGGTSDEVIRQSFNGLTYTCISGRSGGYADIPDKGVKNFIDPVYVYSGTGCDGLDNGHYAVVQSSFAGDFWRNRPEVKDHTGVAGSGALFINAIGGVGQAFYKFNLDGLCNGTRYEFSAYYASLATGSEIKPNIEFDVLNGAVKIESVTSGIIPVNEQWYKAEVTFLTPSSGSPTYTLQLVNLVTGASGNDVMIDDIVVKKCTPSINLYQDGTKDTALAVCNNNAVNLKVTTFYDLPLVITGSSSGTVYYQWMSASSPGGPWILIGSPETTGSYSATPTTTPTYYRAKVSADQTRAATGLPPLAAECGNDGMTSPFKLTKDGNFSIPPVTGTTAYCPGATMTLTGDPSTADQWEWRKGTSFGTATVLPGYAFSTDPVKKVFTKTFATGDEGNYYFIAKQASGCEGNAAIAVTANPVATATISGTTTVCQNATNINITFTGANGTAPYTFTYNIDGGTNQNITTVSGNSVTVAAPTATSGTHVYNLVNVAGSGTSCSNAVTGQSATITVNPLPDASIGGTITVQQNATAPDVTFTGSNGTAPYTFTYNINGGTNQNITTVSGNSITIAAPTSITGTFVYNLVSVKDAGTTTCSKTVSGSATITVSDLPGASVTGTAAVCKNGTPPVVTFTGSNGTAPYTFTYNINGGINLTVTTVSGNAVTVTAPTNTTGIFIYTVTQVKESSAIPVTNAVTGQSVTITVNEPTAPTGTNNARCGTGTVALSAAVTGAASDVLKWYSDAALTNLLFTGANFTTPNISTTTDYYVTETTTGGCQGPSTKVTATVNPGPAAPTGTGAAKCGAGTLTLSATLTGTAANTIKWYSDAALTTQVATGTSFTTPNISATTDYYITETNAAGCASSPVTVTATINAAASAPTVSDGARCGAGTVILSASLSGGATDVIKWYSDAALATQVATGISFTTASISATTNYYVTETTTPGGCVSTSVIVKAVVSEVPTAGFTAAVDCANKSVTFANTSNGNGATISEWTWNYDDGSGPHTVTNGNTFDWPYPTGGTHTVTLAVKTSEGCVNTVPFAQTIVFGSSPVASFTVGDLCLANGAATFTNTSTISDGTLMTYSWDFGDGTPVVNVTPAAPPAAITHPYAAGGNYNVILTATSTGGCTGTVTKQVAIIDIPAANGNIENINTLCSSKDVKLINTSTIMGSGAISKLEVYWDYPDLNNKTTDNQPVSGSAYTHPYPEFGTPLTKNYTVVVRAYNVNGCSSDFTQPITVLAAPKIQLTALPGICLEAASIDISSSATDIFGLGGTIAITGDGVNNNLFTPSIAGAGTHAIHYESTAPNGCIATAEQNIIVRAVPVNNFRSSYTVLENEFVQLQPVSPMSTDLTYQWSPATYLDDANSPTPTVTNPAADITYSLTLTSADNCSLDTSVQIIVLSDFIVTNTFTPNNDGVHDKWVIKKLSKYPNHKIQIFNRYGQVVYETTNFPVDGWDGMYKGKLLPFGTYYYIIELGGVRYPKKGFITIIK